MGSIINYIISFRNKQLDEVEVKITDYQDYDESGDNTVTNIDLIGVAPALEIDTFNINEDKFSNIFGQRATIRFKSTNAVNFSTFSEGEDNRFFVRATYDSGTKFIFSGWLIMDDNQQAYLAPGQVVTLYATDNLGSLKDIELSDFNDARPVGKHKIITIVAWCLNKAEGFLDVIDGIKVANNLFEINHANRSADAENCPLNQTYVDVLTFEKEINEFEDCFTVLEKILHSIGARLCYYNNYWYILRWDEYKNSYFDYTNYNPAGVSQSGATGLSLDKLLDTTDIKLINAETIQRLQRQHKSATVRIEHLFPKEITKNIDFTQGTARAESPEDPALTEYDFTDDWQMFKGPPNVSNNGDSFIRVLYNALGYETERYAVFAVQPSAAQYYLESNPIYVCGGDKFDISADVRHNGQVETAAGSGNYNVMQVRLYADDGTYYTLDPVDDVTAFAAWVESDSTFSTNNKYFKRFYDGEQDDTDWSSVGTRLEDVPKIPKTGYITICLHQTKKPNEFETHFQNLKFNYYPLINGSYRKTKGEYYRMSSAGIFTKKYDEKYFLFDAPCKMFKGAMFYLDTGVYYLTTEWYDAAILSYAPSEVLAAGEKFLKWQSYAAWNQARLSSRIINAVLFGLDTANGHAGIIHKYSFLNSIYPVSNQNFVVLSMRQDWHTCQWSATFAQINWIANRRSIGDFESKYYE